MTDLLFTHGPYLAYVGIAFFIMLTGAGFPLPEEVFIIAAGAASAQGALNPWIAFAVCLGGGLLGDCLLYWIGYHFGRSVIREHHWWARFVHPERVARVARMIDDHGLKVLFVARFLVGIRAPIYLSAGILRVRFRRFLLTDLFCATMVIGTCFGLSYFLSDQYGALIYRWIREAEVGLTVAVLVAVAAVGIYLWRRHRRRLAAAHAVLASGPASTAAACDSDQNAAGRGGDEPNHVSTSLASGVNRSRCKELRP